MAEDKIEYKAPTGAEIQSIIDSASASTPPSLAQALSQTELTGTPSSQSQKVKYIKINDATIAVPADAT